MLKISEEFKNFKISHDTLRIYMGNSCIFRSESSVLVPLVEYITKFNTHNKVLIMDKVLGNAAALLAIKAGAEKVCSPLGSQLALQTLNQNEVGYTIEKAVPFILAHDGKNICPMEKLSLGKDANEFYDIIKTKKLY